MSYTSKSAENDDPLGLKRNSARDLTPTQYAVMRCQKHKSRSSIKGSLKHTFREEETPNADPNRLQLNKQLWPKEPQGDNSNSVAERIDERLPDKIRKNGVHAVEYVMTASPEWFAEADSEKQHQWAEDSIEWLREKYGEENLMSVVMHADEKTTHLTALVTPITKDGRLSAREFIGGTKDQLSKDQDSYHEAVAHHGLTRGIKGSKAQHTTVKDYYKALNSDTEAHTITAEDLKPRKVGEGPFAPKESPEQVAERLNEKAAAINHFPATAAVTAPNRIQAAEAEVERVRNDTSSESARTIKALQGSLSKAMEEIELLKMGAQMDDHAKSILRDENRKILEKKEDENSKLQLENQQLNEKLAAERAEKEKAQKLASKAHKRMADVESNNMELLARLKVLHPIAKKHGESVSLKGPNGKPGWDYLQEKRSNSPKHPGLKQNTGIIGEFNQILAERAEAKKQTPPENKQEDPPAQSRKSGLKMR